MSIHLHHFVVRPRPGVLSNKNGWQVLAEPRHDGLQTPILFLTPPDDVRAKR
jgi:hypothetical protein